jgi:PAS domain S-box-containing protein
MAQTQILVVEDEGIVALEIQTRLNQLGYHVPEILASGEAAVSRAIELQPDLVLMDIRLKGNMDGVTAAEQLRRVLNVPIIFLTAYADKDTLGRAKVTEPYGYILKPFEVRELHIAIEMALYKHQAERRIQASERWLTTTFHSIGDAVFTTDGRGLINLMNPVAEELTGWSLAEAQGQPAQTVFPLIDEKHGTAGDILGYPVRSDLADWQPAMLLVTRAGREVLVQHRTGVMYDAAEQVVGAVVLVRDITRQRAIEQELNRALRLESLGLVAGGIAHDFNNLLSAMNNHLMLIKAQQTPEQDAYRRVGLVEKALWRGQELTQQLLTFAKGGAPLRKVASILEPLREAAQLALADAAIQPLYDIDPHLWAVEIDAGQIGQAFHNLFTNAKEAMPHGGTLQIRLRNVWVDPEQFINLRAGRYLQIVISDTGVGIAREHLAKIFDPYFTTKPQGNGLGLATTHSIITRHNGRIEVASQLGNGTTFTLHLPAADQAAQPAAVEATPSTVMPHQGHILLMDDEEMIREATGALLEHLGYTYVAAQDGAEAVALYQRALEAGAVFDAVILDLTVPGGVGGRECMAQLLALDPQVKALVSSGYFQDPIVANYESYGFRELLSKPYTLEAMSQTLYRLIHLDGGPKRS